MMRFRRAACVATSSAVGPITSRSSTGPAAWHTLAVRVSGRLWQYLLKRLHLDAVEDAFRDVGVTRDERPHIGERVGLDDDQAAGAVEERPGRAYAPRAHERLQVRQVGGAYA